MSSSIVKVDMQRFNLLLIVLKCLIHVFYTYLHCPWVLRVSSYLSLISASKFNTTMCYKGFGSLQHQLVFFFYFREKTISRQHNFNDHFPYHSMQGHIYYFSHMKNVCTYLWIEQTYQGRRADMSVNNEH